MSYFLLPPLTLDLLDPFEQRPSAKDSFLASIQTANLLEMGVGECNTFLFVIFTAVYLYLTFSGTISWAGSNAVDACRNAHKYVSVGTIGAGSWYVVVLSLSLSLVFFYS